MSQWGKEIQVGKARFITHVQTNAFDPIRPGSVINYIVMLSDGGDLVAAESALSDLKAKLIGRPYEEFTWN